MPLPAEVDLSQERMAAVVARHKAALAWGGRMNLSPADDVLISVERPLRLDTYEQMVASILSKKVAAGSTHLVIDIPLGPTAKVRSRSDAVRLRTLMYEVHVGCRRHAVRSRRAHQGEQALCAHCKTTCRGRFPADLLDEPVVPAACA